MSELGLGAGSVVAMPTSKAGETTAFTTVMAGFDAGTSLPYQIPDPRNRPRKRIRIDTIFLPVAVAALGGTAAPTQAVLTLRLADGGRLFFSWKQTIAVKPGVTGTQVIGNELMAEDFVNPLTMERYENPTLTAAISYDQDVIASSVYVCAQAPAVGVARVPTPGSFTFEIDE